MLELLRRGIFVTQVEEPAEDSQKQNLNRVQFQIVQERPLIGLDFDGEENEAKQHQKQQKRLDQSALLNEQRTDGCHHFFADN